MVLTSPYFLNHKTAINGVIKPACGLTNAPIAKKIAEICKLDFFSTEIALTDGDKFVVVDYVNDMCDMRRKSQHYDGVPDNMVDEITMKLVSYVEAHLNGQKDKI